MATFSIPEWNVEAMEKKLKHIQKKCTKYGNSFSYIKGEPFFKQVTVDDQDGQNHRITVKFYPVEVEGTAHIDDWEFIATLEHHHNGNIIKRYNTDIEIPERFGTSPDICEHCNSNRKRINLYIIHNTKTDEWKQVGKSCLKSFTGGLSAEYVAAWMECINFLADQDCDRYDPDVLSTCSSSYYDINRIISTADAVISKYGYRKAEESDISTKDIVLLMTKFDVAYAEHFLHIELPTEDKIYTEQALQKAELITNFYINQDGDSEFLHNVKVILSEKYCNLKNIGLLAYLPFGYMKAMERQIQEENRQKENALYYYFGEIGKRYKDVRVNLSILTSYSTNFGYTFIYQLKDDKNHVFTWKTVSVFEPGVYIATLSVKDHKEYRGQKQTEVTRCRLEQIEA